MPDYEVKQPVGTAGPNGAVIHTATANLSDNGTYDTGLSSIDQAFATSTSDSGNIVNVSDVSSGTITVELKDDTATTVGSAEDIHLLAFGQR